VRKTTRITAILLAATLAVSIAPALAQPSTGAQAEQASPPAAALPTPTQPQDSGIVVDPKTGSILFTVNGREEARIDAAGRHIRQALEYGTTSQAAAPYHEIGSEQGVK
jgi:hypothetical protein